MENKWKWLVYSQTNDGAYCKYCVIFYKTEGGIGSQILDIFVINLLKRGIK